uniref:Uromodulin-like n=1 Tax=Caenorhabditis tropicalis TaxID=1561998 RepID=A0A1I7UM70_9PELO
MEEFGVNGQLQKLVRLLVDHVQNCFTPENVSLRTLKDAIVCMFIILSEQFHIRNCSGNNSRYYPCNSASCVYPAQRSCCIPYVSMVINGTMQCGPFPKEASVTSCCPIGGIWSEWSSYAYNTTIQMFERTRKCLVTEAGCSCVGDSVSTMTACPCKPFNSSATIRSIILQGVWNVPVKNASLDPSTCIYEAELDDDVKYCTSWKREFYSINFGDVFPLPGAGLSATIRYMTPQDLTGFVEDRVFNCSQPGSKYIRMYCDFDSLTYRYYRNNAEVYAWSVISKVAY